MKRFACIMFGLLFSFSIVSSKEFKAEGFTIIVPDDWVEIPREILNQYENSLSTRAPNAPIQHYEYGFQLVSGVWFTYPYVLIQNNNSGRIAKKEITEITGYSPQDNIEKIDFGATIDKAKVGELLYEKETNIIWTRVAANIVGIGPVEGITGIMPTEKGVIIASGASLAKDYAANQNILRQIIASITPDENLIYREKFSEKYPFLAKMVSPNVIGKTFGVLFLAGLISLVSWLGKKINKNRKEVKEEERLPFYRDHFVQDKSVKKEVILTPVDTIDGKFIKEQKITDKPLKFPCPICNKLVVSSFCKKGDPILCRKCNNNVIIPDNAEYIE